MAEGKRRAQASDEWSWLFKAAFAARPAIFPGTFVVYNLGIGLLLLLGAVLVFANSQAGSAWSALLLAVAGSVLSAGMIISRLRPAALARTLALHGALFLLLAVSLALSALYWALGTGAPKSLHYLPGMMLVPSVYGALQLAAFGPWSQSSRQLRLAGVWFGIALELGVLAGFAVHLTFRP